MARKISYSALALEILEISNVYFTETFYLRNTLGTRKR